MKRLLLLCAVVAAAIGLMGGAAAQAEALVMPNSYYNERAWTWEYAAGATSVYNCLAYAMGFTDRWLWPLSWGNSPSVAQVTSYMDDHGRHPTDDVNKTILIAYGFDYGVVHFSKVVTESPRVCNAKWGQLERLRSYAWDPYSNVLYGHPKQKYKWDHE